MQFLTKSLLGDVCLILLHRNCDVRRVTIQSFLQAIHWPHRLMRTQHHLLRVVGTCRQAVDILFSEIVGPHLPKMSRWINLIGDSLQGTPGISQRHLEQALQHSRPSVSSRERVVLQRRFSDFQGGHQPGGQAKIATGKGKKATLA